MREAIQTDMFELYYQPQIDMLTGTVTNAEALVRLHHPSLGMISPADFIPVAEDTGLIIELGNWITRQACLQAMAWQKSMPVPITVSVNVSSKQISQPNFVPDLVNILHETGIDTALIEIELTESVAMNNAQENIEKLLAIKALGIKLSIDDFGTGYSSLSYLKKFPIDTLKIDRSFVVDLSMKEEEEAIVSAIFAMAFALKLDVVVEGIETLAQLDCIKRICGRSNVFIQGYYISKPLPANEYAEFVAAFKV
jgi:EAL domain-containing protein (putative c-di-GMP-specific phosphodiesterase class I)